MTTKMLDVFDNVGELYFSGHVDAVMFITDLILVGRAFCVVYDDTGDIVVRQINFCMDDGK